MLPGIRLRIAALSLVFALPMVVGCDIDKHDTATGKQKQPPETQSPTDPGRINAGGPGAEGKTPK